MPKKERGLSTGLPTTEPEEVGFSTERLARIGPAMQRYVDACEIPGVITVAARHGQIVHFESRGMMDIEANKRMADDAIFRIASMTKPIACTALMMLYEEGHFLLNDPISRYLPSFKSMMVKGKHGMLEPAHREITFRDCLTHTAGFDSRGYMDIVARSSGGGLRPEGRPLVPGTAGRTINLPAQRGTVADSVEMLAKAPLSFHPGTDWEYNPGHDVVGVLVERVSGQTLDKFLQERIFAPLKMVDTGFFLPREKCGRLAAAYVTDRNEWGAIGLVDSPATSAKVTGPKTYCSGAGGLLSTAADYARFAQMMLNGGSLDGARILGRKTVELMTTNHTGDLNIYPKGPGYGYGLGLFVRLNLAGDALLGSPGSYGWEGAFCTYYFADPKEDLFGLLFSQRGCFENPQANSTFGKIFERMVYQALVGP